MKASVRRSSCVVGRLSALWKRGRVPQYFTLHRAPGLQRDEFEATGEELIDGRHAQHVVTYANLTDGTIVNLFEADSEEKLVMEFERLGLPYEEIHECQLALTNDDLRAAAAG